MLCSSTATCSTVVHPTSFKTTRAGCVSVFYFSMVAYSGLVSLKRLHSLLSVISDCVLNVAGGRRPSSAVTIRWEMSGQTAPLADAMPLCTMWSSTRGMTVACLSTGESNSNRWHHRRRRIPQQRDTGGCELFLLVHRGGAFATVSTAMAHTSPCWSFWGIFYRRAMLIDLNYSSYAMVYMCASLSSAVRMGERRSTSTARARLSCILRSGTCPRICTLESIATFMHELIVADGTC